MRIGQIILVSHQTCETVALLKDYRTTRRHRPVETLWSRWSQPGTQEGDSVPMLSLDSTICLGRGRSQESAPPSDSGRVAC